jgi:hypothetical protein
MRIAPAVAITVLLICFAVVTGFGFWASHTARPSQRAPGGLINEVTSEYES